MRKMWSTEKIFGKYVMDVMRRNRMTPVRIESASTISGMPDLLVMDNISGDSFVELKNIKGKSVHDGSWKIPWRPGQQAWSQTYKANHYIKRDLWFMSRCSWTFVGLDDGLLMVRMSQYRSDAKVKAGCDGDVIIMTREEFSACDLPLVMKAQSYVLGIMVTPHMTVRDYLVTVMDMYVHDVLGTHYDGVDVPGPEEYVTELGGQVTADMLDRCMSEQHINVRLLHAKIADVAVSLYRSYMENG